jgi:hypothetical protein
LIIITQLHTNTAVNILDWIPIPNINKNRGKIDVEGIARKNSITGSEILNTYFEEAISSPETMPMIADSIKAVPVCNIVKYISR